MINERVSSIQFIYPSIVSGSVIRENACGSYRNGMKRAKEYLRTGHKWIIVRYMIQMRGNSAMHYYRQQAYKRIGSRGRLIQYMAQVSYDKTNLFTDEDMQ